MRTMMIVPAGLILAGAALLMVPVQARAEAGGCIKYGAAGAVAGHAVGHGVKGAVGGCVAGMIVRHQARKNARRNAANVSTGAGQSPGFNNQGVNRSGATVTTGQQPAPR